jgi:hypothetical protein
MRLSIQMADRHVRHRGQARAAVSEVQWGMTMLDRQKGRLVFECDSCDAALESKTGDFTEAWAEAKRDGWKSRKIGDVWVHACPDCEVDR